MAITNVVQEGAGWRVTIEHTHNNGVNVVWPTVEGGLYPLANNPFSILLSGACLPATTLKVWVQNAEGYDEDTRTLGPLDRQPSVRTWNGTRNAGDAGMIYAQHDYPPAGSQRRFVATQLPWGSRTASVVIADTASGLLETNVTGLHPLVDDGPVLVEVTTCNGGFRAYDVVQPPAARRTCRDCERRCTDCVGDPVSTSTGNMRASDVDPLPSADFLPLRRSYDSRTSARGVFGRRWISFLDARLRRATVGDIETLSVETEDGTAYVFLRIAGGAWEQKIPEPGRVPSTLFESGGFWKHRDPGSSLTRVFDANGAIVQYIDERSGRAVNITHSSGRPVAVADSFGNWSWTLTYSGTEITGIAVDGQPIVWAYVYDAHGFLTRVDSPAGTWRKYERSENTYLTVIRDGADRKLEEHAYDFAGRALTSIGPSGDITSISTAYEPNDGRWQQTNVTMATGRVEQHNAEVIAGEMRTTRVVGGCASCGAGDGVFFHDPSTGNLLRRQDERGYVTEYTYSGALVASERSPLQPAGCAGCLQTSWQALRDLVLEANAATVETTYTYGSAAWPDRPTLIRRTSIASGTRDESFVYDATTGEVLQHQVTGWTGNGAITSRVTRTTSTALYDGIAGAAFAPGGAFPSSWLTLPQPPRRRKSVDGPRTDVSDVTRYVYYPIDPAVPALLRGHLAAIQNPLGHITRLENYDAFGNARRVVDPNGVPTETTYDGLGRLLTSTLKGEPGCSLAYDLQCGVDLTTTRVYDGAGPLVREVRPDGGTTVYTYDDRARLASLSRGPSATDLRERQEIAYDPATGKKSEERWLDAGGMKRREAYAYDSFARLATMTHDDGASVTYTYDPSGQVLTVRDENHAAANTFYTYDPAGRLTRVEQTLGSGAIATSYAYDVAGNLTSVTDPNGNTTTYLYDDFGQLLEQESPVTGRTTYHYNAAGQLLNVTDANGAFTNRAYDALGRPLYADSWRGTQRETVSWGYDAWAGLGRVASMSDPSGFTAWYYTRAGQMRLEQRNIEGTLSTTQQYRFDRDGNPIVVIHPSGRTFSYTYDYADRPLSVTTPGATIIASAQYLPFGPLRELVYGNGSVRSMTFDTRYRIETNRWVHGPTTLASYEYDHDAAGNITRMDDLVTAGFNRQFGYDDLHRLTTTASGSMLWGIRPYTYDAMGNIRSTATGIPMTYQGTTPKLATVNEGAGPVAVTYDAAGNELTAGTTTSTISPRNYVATIATPAFDYTSATTARACAR